MRALLAALGDRVGAIRTAAASKLGEMGEARAAKALAARLRDGDGAARGAAAAALERLGVVAVPALTDALRDRNPTSRLLAARLLSGLGPAVEVRAERVELVEALRAAVADRDPGVADAAAAALAGLPFAEEPAEDPQGEPAADGG